MSFARWQAAFQKTDTDEAQGELVHSSIRAWSVHDGGPCPKKPLRFGRLVLNSAALLDLDTLVVFQHCPDALVLGCTLEGSMASGQRSRFPEDDSNGLSPPKDQKSVQVEERQASVGRPFR